MYEWCTTHGLQGRAYTALGDLLPREGTLLDVACGPGVLAERLSGAAEGRRVVGIDAAPGALRRAQRRAVVVRGNAGSLPFGGGSFDGVTISGALYLMEEPVGVLREMARVSRGVVAVLEASSELRPAAALRPQPALGPKARLDMILWSAAMRMARRFTPAELTHLLAGAGLERVRVERAAGGLYQIALGHARR